MSRRSPYVEFYQDHQNEFRWRLKAANHKNIANCGEGYSTRSSCERAFFRLEEILGKGVVIDIKREENWFENPC